MSLIPESPISDSTPSFDVALVDGDIFRYEIGSLTDKHPFDPQGPRIPVDPRFIKDTIDGRIARIREVTGCREVMVFLTGADNFRFDIATIQPYKGNRSGIEKPFHYSTVGQYLVERYSAITVTGREADDALGHFLRTRKDCILCSRDKDLWTVPGWHYRWACGDNQPEVLPHYVSEEDAHRKFFTQMLIGDSTDNILGCAVREDVYRGGTEIRSRYAPIPFAKPRKLIRFKLGRKLHKDYRIGCGEKEASKALRYAETAQEMYDIVKAKYEEYVVHNVDEIMLENARLLYMGQDANNLFNWSWIGVEV